mmetsp:Transcript_22260/g.62057  ORF Transcript_22260/g.62057 Transcript_22260/m.62057 type:complete len:97 (+) Transcript_22260:315-605(+)
MAFASRKRMPLLLLWPAVLKFSDVGQCQETNDDGGHSISQSITTYHIAQMKVQITIICTIRVEPVEMNHVSDPCFTVSPFTALRSLQYGMMRVDDR